MNRETIIIMDMHEAIEKNIALYFILSNGVVVEVNNSLDLVDFQSENIVLNKKDNPADRSISNVFSTIVMSFSLYPLLLPLPCCYLFR